MEEDPIEIIERIIKSFAGNIKEDLDELTERKNCLERGDLTKVMEDNEHILSPLKNFIFRR